MSDLESPEETKQCYCSKCRKELKLSECKNNNNIFSCPTCDKKLIPELIRSPTGKKNLEYGIRNNGLNYNIRTNRDSYLTPEQWILFFDQLNENQKITFMFLIHTGGRIMEVQNLRPENINKGNRIITFEVTKKRSARGERRCKPREVRVSSVFMSWYKKLDQTKIVKENGCFDILSTGAANICLKKTLKEIGIQNYYMFSIHNIRKTHENWMLSVNKDLMVIAKRLGHTPETAMKVYVQERHFSDEQDKLILKILGDDIY